MKIDIAELPKIRELLEELQQNVWTADQLARPMAHPTTEFKVEDREHNEMHTISHAELLGIFNTRVEAGCKHLVQRYQIDFKRELPLPPIRSVADIADTSVDETEAQ